MKAEGLVVLSAALFGASWHRTGIVEHSRDLVAQSKAAFVVFRGGDSTDSDKERTARHLALSCLWYLSRSWLVLLVVVAVAGLPLAIAGGFGLASFDDLKAALLNPWMIIVSTLVAIGSALATR